MTNIRVDEPVRQTHEIDDPLINENFRELFTKIPRILKFQDRGDPAAYDYEETGDKSILDTDGDWHDLDLSAIVPTGAKAILLRVSIQDDSVGSFFLLRKNGRVSDFNIAILRTQVADAYIDQAIVIACDTNRVIEYKGSDVAFSLVALVVSGWWK